MPVIVRYQGNSCGRAAGRAPTRVIGKLTKLGSCPHAVRRGRRHQAPRHGIRGVTFVPNSSDLVRDADSSSLFRGRLWMSLERCARRSPTSYIYAAKERGSSSFLRSKITCFAMGASRVSRALNPWTRCRAKPPGGMLRDAVGRDELARILPRYTTPSARYVLPRCWSWAWEWWVCRRLPPRIAWAPW